MHVQDQSAPVARITEAYRSLWEDRDLSILDTIFSNDTQISGPVTRLVPGGTRPIETVEALLSLIDGPIKVTYTQVEDAGDWILCFMRLDFTDHPTRADFSVSAVLNCKHKEGRLIQVEYSMNYLELFEGLGQMPDDTLSICLSGEKLAWKS